jgi:MFS family permease
MANLNKKEKKIQTPEEKKRNSILGVLFVGVLMGALDIAIVGPALPAIKEAFTVNDRLLTWMVTIYVLFNLIGTMLMAKLSDIFGRRMVYVADVAIFAFGSLIVSLSPSFSVILIGRAIQGFGAGGIFPVASAVIGDTFPPEKRGQALGLIGAVFGIAFIIGPILGSILLRASWHWLFIINLPIAAGIIFYSLRLLPTGRKADIKRFDWPGMLVLGLGLASLALSINQLDTKNLATSLLAPTGLPLFLVAVTLLVLFVFIERRAASPVVRMDLFQRRQMVLTYLLAAGAGLGEASLTFMVNLAAISFGLKSSEATYLLAPVILALAIGSPVVGRLLDKFGSKMVIISGALILAAGLILLGTMATNMTMFLVAGAFIGLGLSALLGAPMRYILLNEASKADRSVAQGVLALFGSIGLTIGSAMVGAVAESQGGGVGGYESAFLVIGGIGLVMVLMATGLKDRASELVTVRQNEDVAARQAKTTGQA